MFPECPLFRCSTVHSIVEHLNTGQFGTSHFVLLLRVDLSSEASTTIIEKGPQSVSFTERCFLWYSLYGVLQRNFFYGILYTECPLLEVPLTYIIQVEEEREWEEGKGKMEEGEGEGGGETELQVDKLLVYKSILELLQPGETVTKVTEQTVTMVMGDCYYGNRD